jgi:hypothetical protein
MKTKINFIIYIIITAVFTSSCKKSDDNSSGSTPSVSGTITTGSWRVSYYHESNSDHTSNFNGYTFTFNNNGTMAATNSSGTTNGTWNKDDSSNELHLSIGNSSPLNDLSNGWVIISNSSNEIDLKDDNSSHNEELHFTKN